MRTIYAAIAERLERGAAFALATLVRARHASPAPVGTSLVVDADGSFVGNVGAGCHEAMLVETAQQVLAGGSQATLEFNVRDDVFDGSACGASLTVAVWRPDASFLDAARAVARGRQSVRFSCAGHPLAIPAKRSLAIVGATALASELTRLATAADFFVTVVDPRAAFATPAQHPHADRLIAAWPQDALPQLLADTDALVSLAHDSKIDLPALGCALDSNVAYVGVLGSRRAQRVRREQLRDRGYGDAVLARLHGPVGLDLGDRSDAAIACSIFAEILCVLNERTGQPMSTNIDSPRRSNA